MCSGSVIREEVLIKRRKIHPSIKKEIRLRIIKFQRKEKQEFYKEQKEFMGRLHPRQIRR